MKFATRYDIREYFLNNKKDISNYIGNSIKFEDLEGLECMYYYKTEEDDTDIFMEMSEETTIRCIITGVKVEIEDKWPYSLELGVYLMPINEKDYTKVDMDDLQFNSVSLDLINFNY